MITLLKSGEDYLEAIYNLSLNDEKVKSVDIARLLGVTKPSTFRALEILSKDGYILKENYGAITITKAGKEKALQIIKKHNALKKLLTDFLGVCDSVAEIDACKIEHNLSDETAQKLFDFLDKNSKK